MTFTFRLKKIFLTPLGTRMSKDERNESRGVALMLVLVSLMLMTSVVFDMSYNETVRFEMAIRTRDSVKAEALASGGLNWALLFLAMQDKLQDILAAATAAGLQTHVNTVWQLPLTSDMLKGFVNGSLATMAGLDVSEALAARNEKKGKSKEFDGGFGNFDGSFTIEMIDEESKISLQDFGATPDAKKRANIRKLLSSLISPKRYDDLFDANDREGLRVDRGSVISNLFDWIDANELRADPNDYSPNWGISGSSSEKNEYLNYKGILPKNAYFDSLGELRLVHGVTDDFEQAFFDSLTIYGQGGKINILSAKDQVVEAVLRFCALNENDPLFANLAFADELIAEWRDYGLKRKGPMTVKGFTAFLDSQGLKVNEACETILDVKSKTFTLTSKATIGKEPNDVTRTLTLVARVVDNGRELYYFRSR